jgi:hypothetical protein
VALERQDQIPQPLEVGSSQAGDGIPADLCGSESASFAAGTGSLGDELTVAFQLAYGMTLAPGMGWPVCPLMPSHPTEPPAVMSVRAVEPRE